MRATWSGMISFGLVNVPVKVYAATREQHISFHQLHKDDSGRVGYQKVCKACGSELSNEEIIKGYEFKKGQYVTLTDEELDRVDLPSTNTIAILSFVPRGQIDPLQYEKSYYIAPDENAEAAYALLREALRKTDKVGIAKVTLHQRERIAAVRPEENALILEALYYPSEMVKPTGIGIPEAGVSVGDKEMELARLLVDHMTTEFDPARFEDNYEKALRDLINKKIEGEELAAPPMPQPTNVIDIMEKLMASLGEK